MIKKLFLQMLKVKNNIVLAHIVVWLLFLVFPLLFFSQGLDAEHRPLTVFITSPNYWFFFLVYALLFYGNAYYLVPKLYLQRKYFLYFSISLLLLGAIYFIQPFERLIYHRFHPSQLNNPPPPRFANQKDFPPLPLGEDFRASDFRHPRPPRQRPIKVDIISLFLFGTFWALGITLKTTEQWRLSEKKVIQAESEKLNAELSFLKAQINPHFLFNTLNNIYTLAMLNHPNTASSIMKLSQIMRYVTDDVTEDFVSLSAEIECIRHYIDLQKLRLNERTTIDFEVEGELEQKRIPPLILMTFVENSFKHGISKREPCPIEITLIAEPKEITFICKNKYFENHQILERTGIGIENTRQRLNQLYPQRHSLQIVAENTYYVVYLTLQI